MVYIFSEFNGITDAIYNDWLARAGEQRRGHILSRGSYKDRLLGIAAYRLLCKAVGRDALVFSYNARGKPYLAGSGLCFNLTHCDGLAACAVSEAAAGVDAERIRTFPVRVIERVFTVNEIRYATNTKCPDAAFCTLWTLKESYVKALGQGLGFPLKEVEFAFPDSGVIECSDNGFVFTSRMADSHVVSACADARQEFITVSLAELL